VKGAKEEKKKTKRYNEKEPKRKFEIKKKKSKERR